jgi:gastric intrinsic factor
VPSADSNLTAEGTTSPGSPKEDDPVIVTYTLWVGTNVTENFTISVMARRNSSFYHVMQIAAEQDPHYV